MGTVGSTTAALPSELPPRQGSLEAWGRLSVGADELLPLRPAPQSASPPRLVLLATPAAQLRGSVVVGVWCVRWIKHKDSFGGFHRGWGQRGKQSLKLETKNYKVSHSQIIYSSPTLSLAVEARKGLKRDDALKSWGQCLIPRKPSVKGSYSCLWYSCTHHHLHQFPPHPLSSVHFLPKHTAPPAGPHLCQLQQLLPKQGLCTPRRGCDGMHTRGIR